MVAGLSWCATRSLTPTISRPRSSTHGISIPRKRRPGARFVMRRRLTHRHSRADVEELAAEAVEDIAFYASTLKPSDAIAHIDNDDLITELEPVPEWLEDIASELSQRMVQNTSPEIREHLPASAIAHLLRNRPSDETEG